MILHLQKITGESILIKISSTDDILVYVLYHMQFWPTGKDVWIETGDVHGNKNQLFNVNQIFRNFSQVLINALPAWYVFTGCCYEPSFYGKGRKTCFKALERNTEFQLSFGNIGSALTVSKNDMKVLEEYTCSLYNVNGKTVNEAHSKMFESSYKTKNAKDISKNGKSLLSQKTCSGKILFTLIMY